jgi:hypothetical protein
MAWGNVPESDDIIESLDALEQDDVRALLASVLFQDGSAIMWH